MTASVGDGGADARQGRAGDELASRLRSLIRDVPDFPREGILFKDVTTVFADGASFHAAVDALAGVYRDQHVDVVVGVESRGFVIGAAVAYALGAGFVFVRKQGKLPAPVISHAYTLEYGEAVLEMHADAITRGQRVLVVDDLLATGGTAAATVSLAEQLGGVVVGIAFLVELAALAGAQALGGRPYVSLVRF
ncbi:MAG: adenine phosphoribosyltransferase [Chloroflexi bacterium]|nr:MAG: adenine phosphoribosyltransferase [Chloroflexota bacterium]